MTIPLATFELRHSDLIFSRIRKRGEIAQSSICGPRFFLIAGAAGPAL
jgi:hypothetical protein